MSWGIVVMYSSWRREERAAKISFAPEGFMISRNVAFDVKILNSCSFHNFM